MRVPWIEHIGGFGGITRCDPVTCDGSRSPCCFGSLQQRLASANLDLLAPVLEGIADTDLLGPEKASRGNPGPVEEVTGIEMFSKGRDVGPDRGPGMHVVPTRREGITAGAPPDRVNQLAYPMAQLGVDLPAPEELRQAGARDGSLVEHDGEQCGLEG
jgi:hypothetical protein